jgi:DNA-directed RNA polymerase subunit M/transcription elongation factor TFIIS
MKFCKVCDNMYYISIDTKDPNKLSYYCRNCGDIDNEEENGEINTILNTQFKKSEQTFQHILNKYTKLDPTLPRIYNVPCPNEGCATNAEEGDKNKKDREVLYVRYDEDKLKYLYMCTVCNHTWHSS